MKQIGVLIAWLSGSLAGITAGLYALGFVATIGADGLLGIDSALNSREPGFYIGRGGSLVMRTVIIAIWPALLVITIAAGIGWLRARLSPATQRPPGPLGRLAGIGAAPLAALAMFALALAGLVYLIVPALDARDLLFASEIPAEACTANSPLTMAIFAQDREALGVWFMGMAAIAGTVAGLAVIAHERLAGPGQGVWLSVAAIAGFLTLIEVPLAYGFMAIEIAPPPILMDPPPNGEGDGIPRLVSSGDRLRFLARSDGGLLVWVEQQRLVLWIGNDRIGAFTVGAGAPIAAPACRDGGR